MKMVYVLRLQSSYDGNYIFGIYEKATDAHNAGRQAIYEEARKEIRGKDSRLPNYWVYDIPLGVKLDRNDEEHRGVM